MIEIFASEPKTVITGAVVLLIFLIWTVSSVLKSREAERSRRELYAYVAEGSISPEDAERLIRAANEDADLATLMGAARGRD